MFRLGSRRLCNNVLLTNRRGLHTSRPLLTIKPYLLADIGEGIKECEVIQWFVEPGAKIEEFDPICEVQSDKASVEITSRYSGVVKKLYHEPGQMAHVGKPLVDIDIPDEELHDKVEESPASSAETSSPQPEESQQVVNEHPQPVASQPVAVNKKDGNNETLATPAVRRISRELNVDLSQVNGSGKDGRVLKEDVMSFSKNNGESVSRPPLPQQQTSPPTAEETVVPLTPIQKQMFKTMSRSLAIPHFLYTDEITIDNLTKVRSAINESLKDQQVQQDLTKMSYMPFFIKALSLALAKYPVINSRVSTENDQPVLISRPQHNIGIAMDTPSGLIVPNIKNVESKSLIEIATELQRLQVAGQQGKLSTADLKGGTITISNIGTVGGTYLSPVIVDTEVAIVGLGQARKLPRYDDQMNVVPTTVMNTSWSGDHRVIDGMTMARMVDLWKSYVQQPSQMMMHMK